MSPSVLDTRTELLVRQAVEVLCAAPVSTAPSDPTLDASTSGEPVSPLWATTSERRPVYFDRDPLPNLLAGSPPGLVVTGHDLFRLVDARRRQLTAAARAALAGLAESATARLVRVLPADSLAPVPARTNRARSAGSILRRSLASVAESHAPPGRSRHMT